MHIIKSYYDFFCIEQIEAFCDGICLLLLSVREVCSSYIIIDRTNWKFGKKNINVFTLGVMAHRCFIPLCWMQLDKMGNSNFEERKGLVNRFISLWIKAGKSIGESILISDREFIGQQWLEYLKEKKMSFILRLRDNMYFDLQVYATGKKTLIKIISQIY